jgi:hypothetical protein
MPPFKNINKYFEIYEYKNLAYLCITDSTRCTRRDIFACEPVNQVGDRPLKSQTCSNDPSLSPAIYEHASMQQLVSSILQVPS